MIVYHGSDHNFKTLRIGKSLCDKRSTVENEGYGIYFSTDRSVAESYGRYIYTLEINDKYLIDFRKRYICSKYVNAMVAYAEAKSGTEVSKYLRVFYNDLVTRMMCGGQCLATLHNEIKELLGSDESWYFAYSDTKKNKAYSAMKAFSKENLKAYMFMYHIPNIGVLKDVSDNIVRIINKEERC